MAPTERARGRRSIAFRYWVLSALFGLAFGLRYTVDLWMFAHVLGGSSSKFLVLCVTFAGMGLGEIASSWISDSIGRVAALRTAAGSAILWAAGTGWAIEAGAPSLFIAAAGFFGLAMGLYHSSLDAWYDAEAQHATGSPATDRELSAGYLYYNLGYLLAATAVFPLIQAFRWEIDVDTVDGALRPLLPYGTGAMLGLGILLALPWRGGTAPEAPSDGGGLGSVVRNYRTVLAAGGLALVAPLAIGTGTNVMIQYIDHFAVLDLLPGGTLANKTINIAILNVLVVVALTASTASLGPLAAGERLSTSKRRRVIGVALGLAFLLGLGARLSSSVVTSVLLGLLLSILLTIGPLVKAWMLTHATGGLRATALSLLGLSRRITAIALTTAMYFVSSSADGDAPGGGDNGLHYWVILGGLALCIVPCWIGGSRNEPDSELVPHPRDGGSTAGGDPEPARTGPEVAAVEPAEAADVSESDVE